MPVPPKHAELEIYFQCRIIGCLARCAVSPKQSGRLGDHWREKHVIEHGPFNGREVLVKTRNADGTFATQSFDSYATANGIVYRTQKCPRPTRHANTPTPTPSSKTRPRAPMEISTSLPAVPTLTAASAIAVAQPTSSISRIDRMQRQLRIASMPARLQAFDPADRDTLDSHPDQPVAPPRPAKRAVSTRLPLKRNLSQAFSDARSSPTQATSSPHIDVNSTANTTFSHPSDFPSAPKILFSKSLISHLRPNPTPSYDLLPPTPISPHPLTSAAASLLPLRTALSATQALCGTLNLQPPSRVLSVIEQQKDYSGNTWSCQICGEDYSDMGSVTRHLRDFHLLESNVVSCMPERDVITMVLASVKIHDEEHRWADVDDVDADAHVDADADAAADGHGKVAKRNIKRNTKQGITKSERREDPEQTGTEGAMEMETSEGAGEDEEL